MLFCSGDMDIQIQAWSEWGVWAWNQNGKEEADRPETQWQQEGEKKKAHGSALRAVLSSESRLFSTSLILEPQAPLLCASSSSWICVSPHLPSSCPSSHCPHLYGRHSSYAFDTNGAATFLNYKQATQWKKSLFQLFIVAGINQAFIWFMKWNYNGRRGLRNWAGVLKDFLMTF